MSVLNKRNMSQGSTDLSPSQLQAHKRQNTRHFSPQNVGSTMDQGQGLIPDSLQGKIAAILNVDNNQPSDKSFGLFSSLHYGGVTSTPNPSQPAYITPMNNQQSAGNTTPTSLSSPQPAQPAQSTQPLPQGISDNDILRIAVAVKSIMAGEFREVVTYLASCIETLSDENKKLQRQVDDLEMYSRRSCIRVFGVDESHTNTDDVIMEVASKINVPLERKDLVVSHRVGKSTGPKPRAIIARINNYEIRHRLIRESKKLRHITGMETISINQELTKQRAKLAYECRELVRKKKRFSLLTIVTVNTSSSA
ncbi:hypothetical protein FSP39_025341 [Pinctada imbricata]|uniref:Uncharacterized protein n=1 Tax=Pinctada imbricata TaxID=66713 RepID=A0AA88XKE0_PINIB|nr:hypothetical protein FSP39_025341 [Pinctada imbricata]